MAGLLASAICIAQCLPGALSIQVACHSCLLPFWLSNGKQMVYFVWQADDLKRLHENAIKHDPFISRAMGPNPKCERMRAGSLRVGGQGEPRSSMVCILIAWLGDLDGKCWCAPVPAHAFTHDGCADLQLHKTAAHFAPWQFSMPWFPSVLPWNIQSQASPPPMMTT